MNYILLTSKSSGHLRLIPFMLKFKALLWVRLSSGSIFQIGARFLQEQASLNPPDDVQRAFFTDEYDKEVVSMHEK